MEPSPRPLLPVMSKCTMTMHYFGPNLNLSSDHFADADEVMIEQPPTGCGTVTVFRDIVQRDSEHKSHLHRTINQPSSVLANSLAGNSISEMTYFVSSETLNLNQTKLF